MVERRVGRQALHCTDDSGESLMAVPSRYMFVAAKSASGQANGKPAQIPGPIVSARIPARPTDLVRDYIRHVGGDPAWYRAEVPAHLFPQWVFPLQARGIEGLQYPIQRVLNGGCRLQMNASLPLGEPYELKVQLLDIDDNGRRAVIHQRAITSTSTHPEISQAQRRPTARSRHGQRAREMEARDARWARVRKTHR
ncbi:MAG: hypothetical protein JRF54_01355 [Deltaproteobacteria bacterium]|nr:hypothetical protein [Deltaproteobacteria bacterium]